MSDFRMLALAALLLLGCGGARRTAADNRQHARRSRSDRRSARRLLQPTRQRAWRLRRFLHRRRRSRCEWARCARPAGDRGALPAGGARNAAPSGHVPYAIDEYQDRRGRRLCHCGCDLDGCELSIGEGVATNPRAGSRAGCARQARWPLVLQASRHHHRRRAARDVRENVPQAIEVLIRRIG
jgi:hypothetical protein